jgi:hypothetical protein
MAAPTLGAPRARRAHCEQYDCIWARLWLLILSQGWGFGWDFEERGSSCRGRGGLGWWWCERGFDLWQLRRRFEERRWHGQCTRHCKHLGGEWLRGWKDDVASFLASWVPFDLEAPSSLDGRDWGERGEATNERSRTESSSSSDEDQQQVA